jgi:hypothetical protein
LNDLPPRLLILDGPGGPLIDWYVPRLVDDYEVTVVWVPSRIPREAMERGEFLEGYCHNIRLTSFSEAVPRLLALSRGSPPSGILAFSELAIVAVHTVAAVLGLPGNPIEFVSVMRNKYEQRKLLSTAGVPGPRFSYVDSIESLRHATDFVGFPAILKPIYGVGSMATYRVTAETNLPWLWDNAVQSYMCDSRRDGSPVFLLEEYLMGHSWYEDSRYGTYASVESIVQEGMVTHLAITDKLQLAQGFRETGELIPSVLPCDRREVLMNCTSTAIGALGITNSVIHSEFMFTAEGPRVIEINSRVGGGIAELLHYSYDYDVVAAAAAIAVGRPTAPRGAVRRQSALLTPQCPAKDVVIENLASRQQLASLTGVQRAYLPYQVGDRPAWERGSSGGCVINVIATADTREELMDLSDYLNSREVASYVPAR